jgi:F-type H+-transporting ATPase subunit b
MMRLGSSSTRQLVRTLFVIIVIACGATVFARGQQQAAQDQPAIAAKQASGGTAQAVPEIPSAPGQSKEEKAEEKDQTEQFKHSNSVRLIGRILGLESEPSYWIATAINFAVIAGIILWAGRKALPGMFRARTASIQKAMQEAQKASAEARAKLAEIESRLAKLDSEIAAIRDTAEREAAAEEQRIKAAAEEDARKIIAAAEQEIAAAVKAARRQLTAYAGDLAVSLAQKQIRVDAATDQSLVRDFAGQLDLSGSGKGEN